MNKLKLIALSVGLLTCFAAAPAQAQGVWEGCKTAVDSPICSDKAEATNVVKNVINMLLYVIGILAVIMIIHSGLKYVSSRGDAEMVKSAKNTLLYAVIGLVVAMLSFAIVNFVVEAFPPSAADCAKITDAGEKAACMAKVKK